MIFHKTPTLQFKFIYIHYRPSNRDVNFLREFTTFIGSIRFEFLSLPLISNLHCLNLELFNSYELIRFPFSLSFYKARYFLDEKGVNKLHECCFEIVRKLTYKSHNIVDLLTFEKLDRDWGTYELFRDII